MCVEVCAKGRVWSLRHLASMYWSKDEKCAPCSNITIHKHQISACDCWRQWPPTSRNHNQARALRKDKEYSIIGYHRQGRSQNAFGIFASRFRVLEMPITAHPEIMRRILFASAVLHTTKYKLRIFFEKTNIFNSTILGEKKIWRMTNLWRLKHGFPCSFIRENVFWQCPTLNFGCEVGNIFRNPFPASVRWSNGLKYSSISKSVEQRKVTQLVYHLQHHFSVSFVSFTWSFWCKSFSDYLVAGLWEEMDLLACQILWHFHVYLCHSLICFQKGHHMTPLDMFLPRMCKKKIYDSIYKIYKKQFNYFIILYTKDINII